MSDNSADRNLLFGMFALQLNFVTREQLVAATTEWTGNKQKSLVEVLEAAGSLRPDEAQLLLGLVEAHLVRHSNDPLKSLAEFDAAGQVRDVVAAAGDASLQETIDRLPPSSTAGDPFLTAEIAQGEFATVAPTLGKHDLETPADSLGDRSRNDQSDRSDHRGDPLSRAATARYEVLKAFQRGGLGQVSVARDGELNREVALKEILPQHADNSEARQRFLLEAEITGSLEHPGVVPVYGLGQYADGRPFYAMRFIRGDNLQVAIDQYHRGSATAERQLKFRQLLRRFVDVCNAIEYAHNRCVLHRDLKPGNIMLGKYGETLVVDWGLAKTIGVEETPTDTVELPVQPLSSEHSTQTQMGRIVGTPVYMSPEQAAGRVDLLGPATDIYSLGATLYHLLAGQAPFRSRDRDTLIGDVQTGKFSSPREIVPATPKPLEAICLKAMETNPRDRYLSARALADDVERYLADEPVDAYDEPPYVKIWRWMRRRAALVLSSVAALIVTAIAASIGVVWLNAANIRETALREEAQQNFEMARTAVRDYFVSVSEDTLLNQPGMQSLRDELLRQALAYYQQFLESEQQHEGLRDELAQANYYVGRITEVVESPATAATYYQRAVDMFQALADETPHDSERLSGLGDALNAMGRVMQRQQQWEDARTFYEMAERPRRSLATGNPDNVEYARTLANTIMNLGTIAIRTGDETKGIELLQQAQELRLARLGAGEGSTEFLPLQRDVGLGYFNLGLLKLNQGELAAAEPSMRQAMTAFERVIAVNSDDLDIQRRLAWTNQTLGDLLAVSDGLAEAQPYYDRALKLFRELTIRSPEVPDYKLDIANLQLSVAEAFVELGDTDNALLAVEKAIGPLRELRQLDPASSQYQRDLASALVIAGESRLTLGSAEQAGEYLREAITQLEDLALRDPDDQDDQQLLQRALAAQARLTSSSESDAATLSNEQNDAEPDEPTRDDGA